MPDAPPISPAEEMVLSWCLQMKKEAATSLSGELYNDDLHARIVRDYHDEFDQFVERFSYIVVKAVNRFEKQCHNGVEPDDLRQAGFEGLLKAAHKQEFNKRFLPFAQTSVERSIMKFLDDNGNQVRHPTQMIENVFTKTKLIENDEYDQPRYPSDLEQLKKKANSDDPEVSRKAKDDINRIKKAKESVARMHPQDLQRMINPPISLNHRIDELIEFRREPQNHERYEMIHQALNLLDKKFADILIDHFFSGMSIAEIGKKRNYTKQRAKVMVDKSLHQLQKNEDAMIILRTEVWKMRNNVEFISLKSNLEIPMIEHMSETRNLECVSETNNWHLLEDKNE